jgi:ureidoacrylate peracid hydrolase
MLGYKVVFVSDATAAFTDEEHNAALLSMAAVFAEVRDTKTTIELISSVPAAALGAATVERDFGIYAARTRTVAEPR